MNDPAFEIEYAPFGVDSGLCMGVAATAFNDEGVTLQPCGVSSKTVWIADIFDSPNTLFNGYIPAINGSDTNFSQPFVLTYPNNSVPDRQAASAARRHQHHRLLQHQPAVQHPRAGAGHR